ncbi:AAA family ATPase [Ornithinimicrobium murale]|uniref:AAA family ATPase n=1 Tax=Ornithinimicrobium murale TaxID=1050153 RepID=UPI00192E0DF6|nr:ATP-binding protein [Ornithinimicrobium murale]
MADTDWAQSTSRVIFMCGPAGSGKSTIARRLERDGMVRLSIDQLAWDRGFRRMPLPEEVHRSIEATLRAHLVAHVARGTDVVLDLSFWSLAMREDYRALLRPLGIEPETLHLATNRETCLSRVRARAADHEDDFQLSEDLAALYFDHFEVPTSAEGPLTVLGRDD